MTDDWNPVTYNPSTRQLVAVPDEFDSRELGVLSIAYSKGIDKGASVSPGGEFATVQWEDNSRDVLIIPDNCSGTIEDVNRNILCEDLPFEPQWLLSLLDGVFRWKAP